MNFLKKKAFIIPVAMIIYIALFFISSKLGGSVTLIGGFGALFYLFKKNDKFKSKHILLKVISTGLIAIFTLYVGFMGLVYDPKEAKEIQLASEKLKEEKQAQENKIAEENKIKEEKAKQDKENEEKAKKALEESARIAENTKKEKEAEEAKKNAESQTTNNVEKPTNNSNNATSNSSSSSYGTSSAKDVTTNEPAPDNTTVYWASGGKSYHSRSNCVSLARSKNIQSGPASSCPKHDPCNNCIR